MFLIAFLLLTSSLQGYILRRYGIRQTVGTVAQAPRENAAVIVVWHELRGNRTVIHPNDQQAAGARTTGAQAREGVNLKHSNDEVECPTAGRNVWTEVNGKFTTTEWFPAYPVAWYGRCLHCGDVRHFPALKVPT